MAEQCTAEVHSGWSFSRCPNKGKVEHEGKWYCGVHNPVRLAAIRAASEARWREESDASDRKAKLVAAGTDLLRDLAPADPAAGAAALRALVTACRSLGLEGTDAPIAAALAQLEAAHG